MVQTLKILFIWNESILLRYVCVECCAMLDPPILVYIGKIELQPAWGGSNISQNTVGVFHFAILLLERLGADLNSTKF